MQTQEPVTNLNALSLLSKMVPNFNNLVHGKWICDFGCGEGDQAIAMSRKGAMFVLGIDTNLKHLEAAKRKRREEDYIFFVPEVDEYDCGKYDLVISQNSMEHFTDPAAALGQMKGLTKLEGQIIITFGPPWHAPYGAHLRPFTPIPWVHIWLPEWFLMLWRRQFRHDNAWKFTQVESGLNKMTISKFERLIKNSGLEIIYKDYRPVKYCGLLARLPGIREFFINHVTVVLQRGTK